MAHLGKLDAARGDFLFSDQVLATRSYLLYALPRAQLVEKQSGTSLALLKHAITQESAS